MPVGSITRGTTNTNRLRRVDRWIAEQPALLHAVDPFVVDLGYGASGVTTFELAARLARGPARRGGARPRDRSRAGANGERAARPHPLGRRPLPGGPARRVRPRRLRGADARRTAAGGDPRVQRAAAVRRGGRRRTPGAAWPRGWQPGGLVVEGTCDELGRVSSWVGVTASGPRTFTISLRRSGLETPSVVAERLPKALIHRNVPGERIHELLATLDLAWRVHAPMSVYGGSQRWIAAVATHAARGVAGHRRAAPLHGSASSPFRGTRSRRADPAAREARRVSRRAAGRAPRRGRARST